MNDIDAGNDAHQSETGFTLIELLVVVIIIGILAAIAIPMFLNQKARSVEAQVKSDTTNLAKQIESAFADGATTIKRDGATLTDGTSTWPVTSTANVSWNAYGTPLGYCITAWSEAGGKYTPSSPVVYDSLAGGLVNGATCGGIADLPPSFLTGGYAPPLPPAPNRMRLVYDLSLGCTDRTVRIATAGTVNGTVLWGDGTPAEPLTVYPTHTYPSVGTYSVTIEGTFTRFGVLNQYTAEAPTIKADNKCLVEVPDWGSDTGVTSAAWAFAGASNLQHVAEPPNTVSDMSGMFADATSFNQPIGDWDTSNVTAMSLTFSGARAFNQPIGTWNTSRVTNMQGTFTDARAFNQPIGTWDTSMVWDMSSMFKGAVAFNQPLEAWSTSSVERMHAMFYGATAFNQPIGTWNTSKVTDMSSMFNGATAFNQPIGGWDTSRVDTMASMFSGATTFDQPIGSWNTSNVTTMKSMLASTSAFNQDIGAWDTSKVTSMSGMFSRATAFNSPLSSWNTSGVTNMSSMFDQASFNQPIGTWDTSKVTDMYRMFAVATAFNQPLNSWNTSNVKKMSSMFDGATSFNQPLAGWDTAKVTDMASMFYDATSMTADLSGWNVAAVTSRSNFNWRSPLIPPVWS